MGNEAFISNRDNLIKSSTVTASSIRSAILTSIRNTNVRNGNGQVFLSGGYTGFESATIDIEVDSLSVSSPQVSQVKTVAAGNGYIDGVSADSGATAQTITITLRSLGTDSEYAKADILGVVVRASTIGGIGNGITISIDESPLVYTDSNYALLDSIQQGKSEYIGTQYDFGALPLNTNGTIKDSSQRISFNGFPGIYRQYSNYVGGKNIYYFTPEPKYNIPVDTKIQTVTGSRTVTITDGITPEVYTNIITVYDFLAALDDSALLTVVGVVKDDKKPNGDGAIDLDIKTESYYLPIEKSGSKFITGLDDISINSASPTQTVEIECSNNDSVGAELWSVTASVDGTQNDAVTGIPYSTSNFAFTIPRKDTTTSAETGFSWNPVARNSGETEPSVCLKPIVLGSNAKSGSYKFTLTQRPSSTCKLCNDLDGENPDNECLGIDYEGGDPMGLTAAHQARRESAIAWYRGLSVSNRELTSRGELRTAINDVTLFSQVFKEMDEFLTDLYTNGQISWDGWVASTATAKYTVIEPSTSNGYRYRAQNAGTTDASEPTWPTVIGNTVVDNDITWECISELPGEAFDTLLSSVDTELSALANIGAEYSYPPIDYDNLASFPLAVSVGETIKATYPVFSYSLVGYFTVLVAGTIGSYTDIQNIVGFREPTNGSTYDVDGVILKYAAAIIPSSVDDIDSESSDSDATGISRRIADFIGKYVAQLDEIRVTAGLDPKGSASSILVGTRCWQDYGDSLYWESDQGYLPAFTNHGYHAAKIYEDGSIASTKEFFFTIVVDPNCAQHLKVGDSVTLTISGVGKTYQIGDKIRLPLVHSEPIGLSGGADGDNTLTFSVFGSVDGFLDEYQVIDGFEADYNLNFLHFTIYRGSIGFNLGDQFIFSVEGGTFQWRINGGAWTTGVPISTSPTTLTSGISAEFERGTDPSFEIGDSWSFTVKQPYALSNLNDASRSFFQGSGSGLQVTVDFGSAKDVDSFVIAGHNIDESAASIVFEGGNDGVTWPESISLDWNEKTIAGLLATAWNVQYVRLTITGSSDVKIQWLSVGEYITTTTCPEISATHTYLMSQGEITSDYIGDGVAWAANYRLLDFSDFNNLISIVKYSKQNGNEPVCFIPNKNNQSEAQLSEIAANEIVAGDFRRYGTESTSLRRMSLSLQMTPVIR